MVEQSKYYTPEIEEFHYNFPYEQKQSNGLWRETEVSFNLAKVKSYLEQGRIRVKHLDREDIESLGFEHENWVLPSNKTHWFVSSESEDKSNRHNAIWVGTEYHHRTKKVIIFKGRSPKDVFIHKISGILFSGSINNKSELKKVLKQIGI